MTRIVAVLLLFVVPAVAATDQRLIQAVKANDAATVRSLLRSHADVNTTEADGSTALLLAAENDNIEIVDLLIGAGANAKAVTRYSITALYFACKNGNAAMIDRLLKAGADPNAVYQEGETPLMTASLTGKVDAVKTLLKAGVNVNAAESWKGQTALMWAASEGNAAAAAMLVEFGADVKAKAKSGFTAFLFAVRNGHIDAAKVLLDHGANINEPAPDGTSPLSMATINAYYELAGVLLDRGADPNLPDPRGSLLHEIAWLRKPGSNPQAGAGGAPVGPPIPKGNVTSLELAKMLLAHGENPNIRVSWKEQKYDKNSGVVRQPPNLSIGRHYISYVGATAFYVAAQTGDYQLMRVLADGGADPKLPTVQNITPLMAAAGIGYWDGESPGPFAGCPEADRLEAVKLALALGNDINAHADFGDFPMEGDGKYILLYYPSNIDHMPPNALGDVRWSGSTALHGAVISNQVSIVKYLVEHGAQIDAKNRLGWTPLMLAEGVFVTNTRHEYPEAAAYLRKLMLEHGLLTPEEAAAGAAKSEAAPSQAR